MLSNCAEATTPAECRYRISARNSRPRAVLVVALDATSEGVAGRLAAQPWQNTVFRTAAPEGAGDGGAGGADPAACLRDLDGPSVDLIEEIDRADLVVLIATAGADASAAALIGGVCQLSGVTTTALVHSDPGKPAQTMSRTLAALRPYSTMLVATSSSEYVVDMLTALRA